MEFLRVTRDAYGQTAVAGISWDLLPWFVGAAVVFIVLHLIWSALRPSRRGKTTGV